MDKKFYISTAIAYASSKPHIGNTYEIVLADAIARHKRLNGYDVYFQTGTDEHGQKIQQKAEDLGCSPQQYVDNISKQVQQIWDNLGVKYDSFVKTTNTNHKEVVARIFNKLYEQGDIYLGKYEGLYCVPCESFFTETQLVEGKCPDCGRGVEVASEDAYFLKLSKYTDRLLKHIEENKEFLQPEFRKTEIINNFIKPGLTDLCVSRTSFNWGIPVLNNENHVIYVWIDALCNYITFLGYDTLGSSEKYKKYWPADIHIVGKDIYRFHAIYWPIILMALNEPLPKKIFGHQWLLMNDGKMSKSKGNVVYSDDLIDKFGLDQIRYYLLSQMPLTSDGIVSYELIIDVINSDLANTLGNLVTRTISMANKYFNGKVKNNRKQEIIDKELILNLKESVKKSNDFIEKINISSSLNEIIEIARRSNKYIDETTPWILYKNGDLDRLEQVLYNILETIRFIAVLLQPFIPNTSLRILEQLNTDMSTYDSIEEFGNNLLEYQVKDAEILFARIEKEEMLKELN